MRRGASPINNKDGLEAAVAVYSSCISGPETSYPRGSPAWLGKKTGIDCDGQKISRQNFSDEVLVESEPVEGLVFKVVAVGLMNS